MSGTYQEAERLVTTLSEAGVRLWAEGDKLRFRAPKGVMTDEHKAAVREHRDAVLAVVRADGLPSAEPDPDRRHEPFPLTDVQAAYLLGRHDVFDYGGVACHGYVEIEFADLDPARLENAWRRLVDRHDMLRATVHPDGHQRVRAEVPAYRVRVLDLRDAEADEAHAGVRAVRAELDHRVYDPEQWPLFEVRVTRTPNVAVLHLSIDMLITDYAGIQVLLADLDRFYTDPGATPPVPAISYRDYLVAERRARTTSRYERDRAYWWRRVDTLPPAPELPLVEPGVPWPMPDAPAAAAPRFRRHTRTLSAERWAAVRARAGTHGVTASTAVLAAYAEVVAGWSRQSAFTLNLTLQGRLPLHADVGLLVGDFTSVVPLEVDSGGGAAFVDRARLIGGQLFDDLEHRLCSGVEVLREVARRRGRAAAMMPVVFTSALGLDDEGAQHGALTGAGEPVYGVSQTPQVWLDCQVLERGGSLVVNWDVREGVFPPGLVEDAFAAFGDLVDGLAEDDLWKAVRPVALPERQARVRRNANATAWELPRGLLHTPVVERALRTPDAVAVVGGGVVWTYAELLARARAVAAALREIPDGPGRFVGIRMDKGPDQVAAVLGVLLAGSAYLPVDLAQPPARRDTILGDARVGVVLTQSRLADDKLPGGIRVVAVDTLEPAGSAAEGRDDVDPDRPAYVIYTSGSSGTPKGVVLSHHAARNTVEDINRRFRVGSDDRVLGLAGLGFDLSVYDIFGPLAVGGTLVLPDAERRGDPRHWAECSAEHGVTVWNMVPAQLQMLWHYLGSCPASEVPDLGALRLTMLSGDWIPVALPDRVRALLPRVEAVSLGGATEAAIWSIAHPIDEVPAHWRSIPYGKPLSNQVFHVRDQAGYDRPEWVPGELWIGGAGVADGYLGDPERTADRFLVDEATGERCYRTGDLGRYLPDGTLEFLGREDQQTKIRGHRIECGEIEAVLGSHPDVEQAVVLVEGEQPLERRLVAFVTPARSAEAPVERRGVPGRASDEASSEAASEAASEELSGRAARAAADLVAHVDSARIVRFAEDMDDVALLAMAHALREVGLFAADDATYTESALLDASGAAPRNRRLVRRWLRVLEGAGLLARDPATGHVGGLRRVDADALARAWTRLEDNHRGLDDGAELIRFLRRAAENLPALLTGSGSALDLLFPQGGVGTAEAAYRDNIISRYVNRAAAQVVADLARAHGDGPLRILEVGAGVGGTTSDVVAALTGLGPDIPVDYLFTDLSRFFLGSAEERFGEHTWMRYGLFDVNRDHAEQGFLPGSFDVVLGANVLHNALSADRVVAALGRLLAPGGHLVVIDTTRENHQVMTSMEFLMTFDEETDHPDFDDVRRGRDRIFLDREEWLAVLAGAGARTRVCLPPSDDILDRFGQTVFAARFDGVAALAAPDVHALTRHVAERLPEYMVPSRFETADALPLTGNGKVDRSALRQRLVRPAAVAGRGVEPPRGDLERRVADLWREVLGCADVGRDDDFFLLGGDSLLLSQLAGRLRTDVPDAAELPWEELVREMLARPTVAALSAYLSRPRAGAPASPLVRLRGDGVVERARLLVHDGSGTLLPYRPLIERLDGTPLLGLALADVAGYPERPAETLVADLAEEYAGAVAASGVRRVDVVGYCMGGMIATETARRLPAHGVEVGSLTVVSSHRVPFVVDEEVLAEYGFVRFSGAAPEAVGLPSDAAAVGRSVAAALAVHGDRIPVGGLTDPTGAADPEGVARVFRGYLETPPPERIGRIADVLGSDAATTATALAVFRHSLRGVSRYAPKPYPGPLTLLRQRASAPFLPGVPEDMVGFWQGVCAGEFAVVDIPGDHLGCMRPPHVDGLADLLADIAAKASSGTAG